MRDAFYSFSDLRPVSVFEGPRSSKKMKAPPPPSTPVAATRSLSVARGPLAEPVLQQCRKANLWRTNPDFDSGRPRAGK